MKIDRYPALMGICINIANCNDIINRDDTVDQFLLGLEHIISADGVDEADLCLFDTFLASLSDEDLDTVADGEHSDCLTILARMPSEPSMGPDHLSPAQALQGLLNDVFEFDYDKMEKPR